MKRNFLCFGDSLTEGYTVTPRGLLFKPYSTRLQSLLNDKWPGKWEVDCQGVSGEETEEMVERLHFLFQNGKKKYQFVTILGGTNDLGCRNADLDRIFSNLSQLHQKVKEHGAQSVWVTVPPIEANIEWHTKAREELNRRIREAAGSQNNVLVDLANQVSHSQENLWSDGIHFSEEGYNYFAELIFKALEQSKQLTEAKV